MDKLEVRNKMTAKQLIISNGADIEFVPGKEKNGKRELIFVCEGTQNIVGYLSPAVRAKWETVSLDELQYAECKKPGLPDVDPVTKQSNWVPCLMMSNKQRVARTLTVED